MKKTQFNSTIKILENKVSEIREQIKTIIASGENFHLLNDLHDEARDTEDEIKDVEREYSRRNWTSTDHYQMSLIAQNID